MRNDSRMDSPRIGNDEVNAPFGVFKNDVREWDTRRELPLSKTTPPRRRPYPFKKQVHRQRRSQGQ